MENQNMRKMEYRKQQRLEHILSENEAASLLQYVELKLQYHTCKHNHRFTQEWLDAHVDFMKHDAILNELEDMGGYCDCAVAANGYEDYEL